MERMSGNMRRIGITTTIPSEVLWAAGCVPVDLNNVFITSANRESFILRAERDGYPRNVCGWIKGMYGAVAADAGIEAVVAVTQGDCSNTNALMETLQLREIPSIPFAYPYHRDPNALREEISRLAARFETTLDAAEGMCEELEAVRRKLDRLDEMTWRENLVHGAENHVWLVSSSDFNGDYHAFEKELDRFLADACRRNPLTEQVRLGYIGVPPILDDLHDIAEIYEARFVFNEMQRQFSMPVRGRGIIAQYLAYTYPYDIFHRLRDIIAETNLRRIHGIIHYVQSFCHRQIEDLIIREKLPVPVLTIEGETPGKVDERTKIRLQAFIEMLQDL